MKAFGIFAPDNSYGENASQVFEEEVVARGGTVNVSTTYDPAATDLIPFAQELGRKDYESRKSELWKLRKEAEAKGGNPDSVVLPPVIDFDAIFLPDNAARIPLACAGLAYEEFPIGEFQTAKNGKTLPLLGLSGWHNEQLVNTGNIYVRSSVFTDVYSAQTANGRAFGDSYRAATGRNPNALEAAVHDAGQLLAAAALSDANDRISFRDALANATAKTSGAGATAFGQEDRRAKFDVHILTIDKQGIEVVDTVEVP